MAEESIELAVSNDEEGAVITVTDTTPQDTAPTPPTSSSVAFQVLQNNDKHRVVWPNVYDEAVDMLMHSIMAYGVADFNKLVRTGKLEAKQSPLPQPLSVVVSESSACINQLKELTDEASFQLYVGAMAIVTDKYLKLGEAQETDDIDCIFFDDENSEKELVYGISVNNKEKQIIVSFRGSVTLRDLLTDAKVDMVRIPNPVEPETSVRIHHGFRDYLYGRSKRPPHVTLEKGQEGRKVDAILQKVVETVEQYPDYSVYVTGHSLGGSLAILTSLELAADDRIPKPVSCISIAAPRVGDGKFATAFFALEKSNAIRCLRIVNHGDIFPRIPQRGTNHCCCGIATFVLQGGDRTYHHVGIELVLQNNGEKRIRYPRYHPGQPVQNLMRDVWRRTRHRTSQARSGLCRENLAVNHSCLEYWSRIDHCKLSLIQLDLHEQYKRLASRKWVEDDDDDDNDPPPSEK